MHLVERLVWILVLLDRKEFLFATGIPFGCVTLLLAWFFPWARRASVLGRVGYVCAIAAVVAYVGYVSHYLLVVPFYDHLEPTVMQIVSQVRQGRPAFHAIDAASRYSMLYGPNTYLALAWAMNVFGGGLMAAKLVQVFFSLAALGLTVSAVRSATPSRAALAAALLYFCGSALLFREVLLWLRGDPQILFWVALGVWGATRKNSGWAAAIVGLAVGGCVNTKIHGFLYLAPAIAIGVRHWSFRSAVIFSATMLVALALPFVSGAVSLVHYLEWLRLAARHGIDLRTAMKVVMTGSFLLFPVIVVWTLRLFELGEDARREFLAQRWIRLAISVGGIGLIMLLASKKGSGEWHLVPLIPVGAFAVACAFITEPNAELAAPGRAARRWLVLAPFVAVLMLGVLIAVARGGARVKGAALARAVREDVRQLATRFPGATAMGYGDREGYPETLFRTELPTTGEFVLDAGALMDMQQSGLEMPAATVEKMSTGAVQHWLIPKGEAPFTMKNFYAGQDLFGAALRGAFEAHYRKTATSDFFDVWTYHP